MTEEMIRCDTSKENLTGCHFLEMESRAYHISAIVKPKESENKDGSSVVKYLYVHIRQYGNLIFFNLTI